MKKIKKILLASVAAFSLTACDFFTKPLDLNEDTHEEQKQEEGPKTIAVSGVSLDVESLEMHPQEKHQLVATVAPTDASDKSLAYSTSRPSVATVSESGEITAVGEGVAVIRAEAKSDRTKFATVYVTVTNVRIAVTDLSVSPESLDLVVGGEADLVATVTPDNADDKTVSYSSFDSDVATVNSSGHVVAIGKGNTYIQVSSNDNGSVHKEIPVSVSLPFVAVTDVDVNTNSITLSKGNTSRIYANVQPAEATNKGIDFSSDNTSVATVDAEGVVTAVENGSATIKVASSENAGIYKEVLVTVQPDTVAVTGVTLAEHNLEIEETGAAQQLHATVSPEEASNKAVQWQSSNPTVASVSQTGLVTPLQAGQTTITVTTVDGNHQDTCVVTVTKVNVTSFSIINDEEFVFNLDNDPSDDIDEMKTHTLYAQINPSNATYKEVTWNSSNPSVASVVGGVNENGPFGTVTRGTTTGTATITALHKNSGLMASVIIKVQNKPITNVELNQSAISFFTTDSGSGATYQLTSTVTPDDAPNKSLTWESSNPSVATVSSTGLVTKIATEPGTTIITASSVQNPNVFAQCSVTVNEPTDYDLHGTEPKQSYVKFLSYSGDRVEDDDEFKVLNKSYKVGADNPINFLPVLNITQGLHPVDQFNWAYPYNISVTENNIPVGADKVTIVSDRTCDLQFTSAAIGHSFKITIIPGGIDNEDILENTVVYDVEIVDGRNVVTPYDLLYLDERDDSFDFDEGSDYYDQGKTNVGWEGGDDIHGKPMYGQFKREHGVDENERPAALIFHEDMTLTKDKIPSGLFYSEEDAIAGGWRDNATEYEKSLGSFKDDVAIYRKDSTTEMKLLGNYFTLDFSKIPYVTRPQGSTETLDNGLNSHASFIRAFQGSLAFEDLNVIGNSSNANTEDQLKMRGGLIFIKYRSNCGTVRADNINAHSCYITMMGEAPLPGKTLTCVGSFKNAKCKDNFNSFLYNWGGQMNVTNCYFAGCGGPVMIQDHTGVAKADSGKPHDTIEHGTFEIYGHKPVTTFTDCAFENFVTGGEAWFGMFGASSQAGAIKSMSDSISIKDGLTNPKYISASGGLTYVFDENHNPGLASMMSVSVFNFIVLNKSGSAEGMTAAPVDGEVIFKNGDSTVDDFNYFNPTMNQPIDMTEYVAYQTFRGYQSNGAPVLETKGGAAYNGGENTIPNHAFVAGQAEDDASNFYNDAGHLAIYFNGMMLVVATGHYNSSALPPTMLS